MLDYSADNQQHLLIICLHHKSTILTLTPRKTTQPQINFYNESITLPTNPQPLHQPIHIYILQTPQLPTSSFVEYEGEQLGNWVGLGMDEDEGKGEGKGKEKGRRAWGKEGEVVELGCIVVEDCCDCRGRNMVFEGEKVRVFWSWELEEEASRKNSEYTRDLRNIDSPKRSIQIKFQKFPKFPKIPKNRTNIVKLFTEEARSDTNKQPSPRKPTNHINSIKNNKKGQQISRQVKGQGPISGQASGQVDSPFGTREKEMVRSKSVDTRSNTVKGRDLGLKRSLPVGEDGRVRPVMGHMNQSQLIERVQAKNLDQHRHNPNPNKPPQKISPLFPSSIKTSQSLIIPSYPSPKPPHKPHPTKTGIALCIGIGIASGLIASFMGQF